MREEENNCEIIEEQPAQEARGFGAERKAIVEELKPLLTQEHTQLAQAKLWLSMAALAAEEKGEAGKFEIEGYLSSAQAQLVSPELVHDKDYAAACRQFAPVFEQYGRGAFAKQLLQNAALL